MGGNGGVFAVIWQDLELGEEQILVVVQSE